MIDDNISVLFAQCESGGLAKQCDNGRPMALGPQISLGKCTVRTELTANCAHCELWAATCALQIPPQCRCASVSVRRRVGESHAHCAPHRPRIIFSLPTRPTGRPPPPAASGSLHPKGCPVHCHRLAGPYFAGSRFGRHPIPIGREEKKLPSTNDGLFFAPH